MDIDLKTGPAYWTKTELETKLDHLTAELVRADLRGIVFTQEGAMRWLTGVRHQIDDIGAGAPSPVQAVVTREPGGLEIVFVTSRIEMPRIQDQLPAVFEGLAGVRFRFQEGPFEFAAGVLSPRDPDYAAVVGRIVRPLVGGSAGNAYAKVSWLAAATTAVLAQTAHELEPGLNGAVVRARTLYNFLRRDIECNVMLVALTGQERHLHPLWESRYTITSEGWVKLVAGARYVDAIVSATVMVKFGQPPSPEAVAVYAALQEGAVEYADCFRNGVSEGDVYREVGLRFLSLERKHGLPGFAAAAYAHHLGGPTSPIGNRDHLIEPHGSRVMFADMQFAINPVEPRFQTKVELQGIVRSEGPPHVWDIAPCTPPHLLKFRDVSSAGGTSAKVAEIIVR